MNFIPDYDVVRWCEVARVCGLMGLEEAQAGKRGEDIDFVGVLAEEFDGADAVGCEGVVNVAGEVVADGVGRNGDAGCPLFDELFDVGEAVIAGGFEVLSELSGCDVALESFRANGPDGCDPGEIGEGVPLVGEVEPLTGADGGFDGFAGFEGEESGVADEDGGVCVVAAWRLGRLWRGGRWGRVLRNLRKRISA